MVEAYIFFVVHGLLVALVVLLRLYVLSLRSLEVEGVLVAVNRC